MQRIDRRFVDLHQAEKKALCVYFCVGDPSLDETVSLALAALDAGADLLELGVPFSDPTADGPLLARASRRALAGGATVERVMDIATTIRDRSDAPLVLFSYYNPLFVMGEERVANLALGAGFDALVVVDLPPEEAFSLRQTCADRGLGLVPIVTPTSHPARLEAIQRLSSPLPGASRGFVYAVSTTGVTGSSVRDVTAMGRTSETLRMMFGMPVLVGFGIDNGPRARLAAGDRGSGPDGIVVGTAIARRIEREVSPLERVRLVHSFVQELRDAIDS
jgi:tryptophan synthase alpha chain